MAIDAAVGFSEKTIEPFRRRTDCEVCSLVFIVGKESISQLYPLSQID
jgi:hypothetical protein